MKTSFTSDQLRQNALDTYNVLSMTNSLQENIDLTFDNVEKFNEDIQSYHFRYWSRVNSLFIEDLLVYQQQIL